jgi:hypothetical protein
MDKRFVNELLNAAADSRIMWVAMAQSGFKPCYDFYRGWLTDAREVRLGKPFKGHGSRGLPRNHRR